MFIHMIRPKSIAVIGASRHPDKIGYQVLKNVLDAGFPKNKVFPINPKADQILGLKCYSSVKNVPGDIDLAVIVVPAKIVPMVLEECGEKGVKSAAIISAGFKEVGNVKLERKLVEIAHKYGFRFLGPNIVGICDTIKSVNASFCQGLPLKGDIVFITQSGALAIALVGWTKMENIGLSDLVSIGNKADVSEIDLMEFFGKDPYTKVITIYLEGTDDGRRFIEVAKRVSRKKPVVVLKAGKAKRTVGAIKSHTGSLAGSDTAYEAAFKQSGVIRAPTFPSLFEWAIALSKLPLPKGENAVIITNGGGAGVMATDAAEQYGVHLMDIPEDLKEKFRKFMPPFGSTYNPIDLTGMAGAEWYMGAIEAALKDDRVHSVIVLYCHTAQTNPREIGDAILSAIKSAGVNKPVVASFIGGIECDEESDRLTAMGVPTYVSPEQAVAALGALYQYYRYLKKPVGKPVKVEVDRDSAAKIIYDALNEGREFLLPSEAAKVAEAYGIPTLSKPLAKNLEEAEELAVKIGFPLVMEVESPQIIHKTDVGGIKVGINSLEDVRKTFKEIMENVSKARPDAEIKGIIVRKMAVQGREVAVGMHRDPIFGPLIMFGSGGIYIELYKDVSFRVAPLDTVSIDEMMQETKIYKLLTGFRGERKGDIQSVKDVIARVSQLALDFPEITDIDINPLFVYEKGCMAIDVKILLKRK